ncbi:helix-turn-helix domain-containing protein [Microvirga antarctica]|uniref:helix-turn-helix domain-containing protein n=1 Tax=Microvirga antarctica TaxID=2819233 RepID=UPI001B30143B
MEKKSPTAVDRHIGTQVRRRRMALGMSQEALGEALGLTFQQIQKYEKGTNRIGAGRLLHIASILDVGIEFFFEGVAFLGVSVPSERRGMTEFLACPDSDRLVESFIRLKDDRTRRTVADLVDMLATGPTPMLPSKASLRRL